MRLLFLFILSFSFYFTSSGQQKRRLVWQDEFNYTGLPDSTKWVYEHGFIRNHEKQYYTYARRENVYVHDGVAEIKGIKENYVNQFYKKEGNDWRTGDSLAYYTSGSINTLGKASWKYGRIEIRARIPKGLGVWPAIWMMGINRSEAHWPTCGEIDIMEFVGHDSTHIFGSIHYTKEGSPNGHGSSHNKIGVKEPYKDFHLYAIEWDSSEIKVFFDDQLYHSFRVDEANAGNDNPFRKEFYILLNLALGGEWGREINNNILPQSFLIDYVRVYQ